MARLTGYNKFIFCIVGVGGTGSLLARDLPKLLIGMPHIILLIDGDIVERKNMARQSYQEQDINENKAVALSAKINSFYNTTCYTYNQYLTKNELKVLLKEKYPNYIPVLIGCVDNDKTRIILENTFRSFEKVIYLDSANSEYEGNIYLALKEHARMEGCLRSEVYQLADDLHPADKSCQEQLAEGNTQFLITNAKMSIYLLQHIHYLLNNELKVGVTNVERFTTAHY